MLTASLVDLVRITNVAFFVFLSVTSIQAYSMPLSLKPQMHMQETEQS